jgi:hypothetical protein
MLIFPVWPAAAMGAAIVFYVRMVIGLNQRGVFRSVSTSP